MVRDDAATNFAALCTVGPLRTEPSAETALGAVTDEASVTVPFPPGNTIEPVIPPAGGRVAVTDPPERLVTPVVFG